MTINVVPVADRAPPTKTETIPPVSDTVPDTPEELFDPPVLFTVEALLVVLALCFFT
jgi:hypothetical protein